MDIVSIQLKNNKDKLYIQLSDSIEEKILDRTIKEGEKLWTIRKLAEHLNLSNSTVIEAYRNLEKKGLVYKKAGSGVYCLPYHNLSCNIEDSYFELQENKAVSIPPGTINLAEDSPGSDMFPVKAFKEAINKTLDSFGKDVFSYEDIKGYFGLRETLVNFSFKCFSIKCRADDILITSGAQQAIDIISKAIISKDDVVLMENPTYTGAKSIFSFHGAKIIGIPVDNDGINLDMLEYYARRYKPRLLYTIPIYQMPTGVCMPKSKQEQLLNLAQKYDFYILEEDLLSDMCLFGSRQLPLKSRDLHERVIFVRSFSKVLMPGIRTGYVIAPFKILKSIADVKYMADISGLGLIQRALSIYLKSSEWEKHIKNAEDIFRKRLNLTQEIIKLWGKMGISFNETNGGFGLWLKLPEEIEDMAVYYKCLDKKVLISAGNKFFINPVKSYRQYIRICYAAASNHQLTTGLGIIKECIKDLLNRSLSRSIYIY